MKIVVEVAAVSLALGALVRGDVTPLKNPCLDAAHAAEPWCDATLALDARVDDMLARMSLEEKIGSLDTVSPAIESLGIPAYNWWSEATHGISHVDNDVIEFESNFALPITTAMSFNRSLWHATAAQIGREARAFMNAGSAGSTYWAPVINLAREPRWGRNIETPGEDPYLTGEYAATFVDGFERNPDDPTHLQASACCKHYAANSMEMSTVAGVTWDRHNFDAQVSAQDLVDSYMLPFQTCVEVGHVSSLMCSYNAINGVPSCANDWLLQTVARESWGFDGYVTSDCDADADVFNTHHYTDTAEEAVAAVLAAGTDVDCTSFVGNNANSTLAQGLITEQDIDARLAMLFRVRMRLGHFDPIGPLDTIGSDVVCSEDARALARDGVAQSVALFKNDAATLPLDAATVATVAVLGPNANLSQSIAGYYGGNTCDGKYTNVVDAVAAYAKTTTALGVPNVTSSDTSGVADAAALAASADATVLVLGSDLTTAAEGKDATSIEFSAGQLALVDATCAAVAGTGKPVVVVTITATPLDLTPLLAAGSCVGAILHAGMPSVQTLGIGDALFGAVVPAGRAIQTVYEAAYADAISIFDFNMRPGPSAWPRPDCAAPYDKCVNGTNPGRSYRFYTGQPVVEFGFGLSYTTFEYALTASAPARLDLEPLRATLADAPADGRFPALASLRDGPAYEVRVTNTGERDADDAVLGFIVPPNAGEDGTPLQSLFGFERVHVPAGETVSVFLYPGLGEFAETRRDGSRAARAGEYTVRFGVAAAAEHGQGFVETKLAAF